jgi:tetratricopeptide (TPR) repeat protein
MLRITSELIETKSGRRVWSSGFDRKAEDLFSVLDETVVAIAASIPGLIDRDILSALRRGRFSNCTAYECELRGRWAFQHWSEGLSEAISWFEKAVEADPDSADALAWLARALEYSAVVNGSAGIEINRRVLDLIGRAVSLGSGSYAVHSNAAGCYLARGKNDLALKHARLACDLNPHDPTVLNTMALVLTYSGSPHEALQWHSRSELIEPYAPDDQRLDILCDTYFMLGNYLKVIEIHQGYSNAPVGIKDVLAAAMAQAGFVKEAHDLIAEMERGGYSREQSARSIARQMLHFSRREDQERWLEGYRKAGLDV